MSDISVTEGTIPFTFDGETYQTWYKLHGTLSSSHPPLVVLHGGPGLSHDYLAPLADLAHRTPPTPVLFYDQLGSARSTHLPSKPRAFWTLDLFVAELANVLAHFDIAGAFDLLGHSWGAVLGAEFVVRRQPAGLRHLVLANGLANSQIRNEARKKLLLKLPEDARRTIVAHEEAGTTTEQVYKDALRVFYATFACTLDPPPPELIYSITQGEDESGGGVSFLENDWDIIDRLHLINVPTLLINGENDYMTDDVQAPFFKGIPKVKWVKFAKSSHVPHWEERERYMNEVSSFLEL
ncbi:proline-specific peptidase [Dentipellis sp. KUC8613]|nr:proline-specific peptidase [Dentipellis sp. KUC8613]